MTFVEVPVIWITRNIRSIFLVIGRKGLEFSFAQAFVIWMTWNLVRTWFCVLLYISRKRFRKGTKPPECRLPRDVGAIEKSMMNSKNRTTEYIFEPVLGMIFYSKKEAYDFCNLYSWKVGFGVRFGKSHTNKANYRTSQEIVCEKQVCLF